MSELAMAPEATIATTPVRILLYSDDVTVRDQVRLALGLTVGGRAVAWTETATHAAVIAAADAENLDLLILDGEAAKSGGMGICRQLKHELRSCPPVVLLVGRPDDAWLATWSEADAAIAHPVDPWELKSAVEALFPPAQAGTVE